MSLHEQYFIQDKYIKVFSVRLSSLLIQLIQCYKTSLATHPFPVKYT